MNLKLNNRQFFLIVSALRFTELSIADLLEHPAETPKEMLEEFKQQMVETRELLEWMEAAEAAKNLEKNF